MNHPLTITILTLLLIPISIPAGADHTTTSDGCAPLIRVDERHAPVQQWTTHEHPRFTFEAEGCEVVELQVVPSWGPTTTLEGMSYHPDPGSGEHELRARVLHTVETQHCTLHLAWPSWWECTVETAEVWSEGRTSPPVRIDTTPPEVEIAHISEPLVQGLDADHVTHDTEITLSARDAHSGIDTLEWKVDEGAWTTYDGPLTLEGEDGEHTLTYRAVDKVGLETVESRDFILDNTAPTQEMIRPNPNSATVDDVAVEACNGPPRVTEDGEPLIPMPEPDPSRTGAPVQPPVHPPAGPPAEPLPDPPVVEQGPDPCGSEVVATRETGASLHDGDDERAVLVDPQKVRADRPVVLAGTVELVLDVEDRHAGTGTVSFAVDGKTLATQTQGDDRYTFTWDTSVVEAGEHIVTFAATDRLGNQGELTFTAVVISSTSPEAPDPEELEPPEKVPTPPEEVPEPPEAPEAPEDTPGLPEPAVALPELTALPLRLSSLRTSAHPTHG